MNLWTYVFISFAIAGLIVGLWEVRDRRKQARRYAEFERNLELMIKGDDSSD